MAPAVASELTGNVHFAVHAEKSAYEPNEPVYLLIDVFNAGATALSVWTGCCTYQVVVHGPGIPLPDSPRTDVCACPGSMIKL